MGQEQAGETGKRRASSVRIRLRLGWGSRVIDEISFAPHRPPKRWLDFVVEETRDDRLVLRAQGESFTVYFGRGGVPFGNASIFAERSGAQAEARADFGVDANFLHTCVVIAAVQACAVSAMLLGPGPLDGRPGAGAASHTMRRLLTTAASAAVASTHPVVVATGRPAEPTERPDTSRALRNQRAPTKLDPRQALSELMGALERAAHAGEAGDAVRLAVGDLAALTPMAQTAGDERGGLLAPRSMLAEGPQSGVLGTGMAFSLPKMERTEPEVLQLPKRVARADIGIPEDGDLNERVRSEVARRVRDRSATVRYCYESLALQKNPKKTGRIVLEFALRPDGYVEDIVVSTEDVTLRGVAACVEEHSRDWFLGNALVQEKTRLSFPFVLQPRGGA